MNSAPYTQYFYKNVYEGIFSDLKDKFPSAFAVLDVYGQSEGGIAVAVGFDQKTLGGTRYFRSLMSKLEYRLP